MRESARMFEGLTCGLLEVVHGRLDFGGGYLRLPGFTLHVELSIVGAVFLVPKLVTCSDVLLEAIEVDWVLVLPVERDAEAQTKTESVEDLWRDRGRIGAEVVYFQIGWFGVESGGLEIGKK